VEQLHNIHHSVRQHLKVTSNRTKDHYDQLANVVGFQEDNTVWLYRPTQKTGISPKLQTCWEGPHFVITQINDVIYWIQWYPRATIMVVHLETLVPYLGATRDEDGAV